MDEDTSDHELPSISLSQNSGTREVVMPSAREVAEERARERRTELELQRLREPPARSDSSGSEGEAALAAAVRALRMPPAPPAPPPPAHAPAARRLLALLPAPPLALQQFIAAFADDASTTVLRKLSNRKIGLLDIDKTIGQLCALGTYESCALSCEYNAFTCDELVTCAGVLSAACLAAPRPAHAARRALHRALTRAHPHRAVAQRLATLAARAANGDGKSNSMSAGRALLALSDAARGGGPLADLLAALLVRRALVSLVTPLADQEASSSEPLSADELYQLLTSSCGGWRRLPPTGRHLALRLVSRALRASETATQPADRASETATQPADRASETADHARLLAALAHPQQADKQHPDYLKAVVAASTLQLLFRAPTTQT